MGKDLKEQKERRAFLVRLSESIKIVLGLVEHFDLEQNIPANQSAEHNTDEIQADDIPDHTNYRSIEQHIP